ncbi:MAG TPA: hypothetical protein VK550_19060 [Polyangiaceae bacterium]|nr:hypothetical protein [Polyangiaceae bacterium]
MNWLEPWVLVRIVAAMVTASLFAYGAVVSARVLRHSRLEAATEGQLLLERHFELAGNLVRFGAVAQLFALTLSVLAADRLSGAIQGAMCGYGVVHQNRWGWLSLGTTVLVSLGAGVLLQLLALDRGVRGLDLMRPLAWLCIGIAPFALLDTILSSAWLGSLDFSVVASCCSTTLGEGRREGAVFWQGPRLLATWGAVIGGALAIATALWAFRSPARSIVTLAGATALGAVPFAVGAVILEVAPHVYEVPEHLCPFCLFKADAYFIGYPLFGALFLAAVWGVGGAVAAILAGGEHSRHAFPSFARSRMIREASAWAVALTIGALPVLVYAVSSPGASLFR